MAIWCKSVYRQRITIWLADLKEISSGFNTEQMFDSLSKKKKKKHKQTVFYKQKKTYYLNIKNLKIFQITD